MTSKLCSITTTVLPKSTSRCSTSSSLREIFKMQTGRRLVEQVQRSPGVGPRQLGGQFHTLGFAAGKRVRRLAEPQIIEPHIAQRLQNAANLRNVLEQLQRLAARHFQHVGDRLAVKQHRQRFRIVAAAAADIALDPHVGQEVHLDAFLAVPFAGFAASAGGVEAEPPRRITAHFRFRQLREQLPDQIEHAGVRGRIARRRVAQRLLIDADDFVDLLDAANFIVSAGNFAGTMQCAGQRFVQNIFDQRAFSASR